MIQRSKNFGFPFEAQHPLCVACKRFRQNLQPYVAPEALVARAIHFSHPARAQRRDNLIRPKFAADCECHLFSFAGQFKTTDMGVISASFTGVMIRNRWPSRLTS